MNTKIFDANGETFEMKPDFKGCYGMYFNRGMNLKHSNVEPEGFDAGSISEEWQYLATPEDFAYFVQNIPNKAGYAPSNWERNKKYFIEYEANKIEG